jgi:hypothetical protein
MKMIVVMRGVRSRDVPQVGDFVAVFRASPGGRFQDWTRGDDFVSSAPVNRVGPVGCKHDNPTAELGRETARPQQVAVTIDMSRVLRN